MFDKEFLRIFQIDYDFRFYSLSTYANWVQSHLICWSGLISILRNNGFQNWILHIGKLNSNCCSKYMFFQSFTSLHRNLSFCFNFFKYKFLVCLFFSTNESLSSTSLLHLVLYLVAIVSLKHLKFSSAPNIQNSLWQVLVHSRNCERASIRFILKSKILGKSDLIRLRSCTVDMTEILSNWWAIKTTVLRHLK